ncbi:MAG: hypothetical protein CO167_13625, partial [Candidatus Marinimicrobia bacterium CG_4_9_14_3_um_filter_48_9]
YRDFIADTKYKIIYSDKNDIKNGISQNDLYQMISYAIRFNVQDVLLLYPNTLKSRDFGSNQFTITDKLALEKQINISSYQLPIIKYELFDNEVDYKNIELSVLFDRLCSDLKTRITNIFNAKAS